MEETRTTGISFPEERTPMTLEQKFVELRKAVPAITKKPYSENVKYKFAKIFDIYQLLVPAMNNVGVNFDVIREEATNHRENGDAVYYSSYQQETSRGPRRVWIYEADITIRWTNADDPNDRQEITLHAIGTNDGGPDKAKGSAWTYAIKYYLFEKFNIDQGEDDPDNFDHSDDPTTNNQKSANTRKTPPKQSAAPKKDDEAEKLQYERTMAEAQSIISGIDSPEAANEVGKIIKRMKHALTSLDETRDLFRKRIAELGYRFDKETMTYFIPEEPKE